MKLKFKLIPIFFVLTLLNCKKENTLKAYKYADKPIVLNCEDFNSKLYHEALYAFENDILDFYGKNKPNATLIQAYSQFIRSAVSGRLKYQDIASPHTIQIFEALKNESDLWDANNPKSHLNYNGKVIDCIANNIQDKKLKTTFNALLSTNSLSPKLFGSPLMTNYVSVMKDKYLASYIAFDLFYANLFNIDFSESNLEKPQTKVDFNKIP